MEKVKRYFIYSFRITQWTRFINYQWWYSTDGSFFNVTDFRKEFLSKLYDKSIINRNASYSFDLYFVQEVSEQDANDFITLDNDVIS